MLVFSRLGRHSSFETFASTFSVRQTAVQDWMHSGWIGGFDVLATAARKQKQQQHHHPSIQPSVHPTIRPSYHPSIQPSVHPSIRPFYQSNQIKSTQTKKSQQPAKYSTNQLQSANQPTQPIKATCQAWPLLKSLFGFLIPQSFVKATRSSASTRMTFHHPSRNPWDERYIYLLILP